MTPDLEELRFCKSANVLLEHWISIKKDDEACPSKQDFSPMIMGAALPDIFLAEYHSVNFAELKVTGSNISEITKNDKTGANVFDICKPSQTSTLKKLYAKVATGRVAAISEHMITNQYGRKHAKALHLPLACKNGEIRYIVGVAKALQITKFDQAAILRTSEAANGMSVTYIDLISEKAPQQECYGA